MVDSVPAPHPAHEDRSAMTPEKKQGRRRILMFGAVMMVLVVGAFFLMPSGFDYLTGYFIQVENITGVETINTVFTENTITEIALAGAPTSLRASGSVIGSGNAAIFLVNGEDRYLLINFSTGNVSSGPGAASTSPAPPANITIWLDYNPGSSWDPDDNGIENWDSIVDFTVANTSFNLSLPGRGAQGKGAPLPVDEDANACTIWQIYSVDDDEGSAVCYGAEHCCQFLGFEPTSDVWDEPYNSFIGRHGATGHTEIGAQIVYVDATSVENSSWQYLDASFIPPPSVVSFSLLCEETCLVSMPDGNITLAIEVNGMELNLSELVYTFDRQIPDEGDAFDPAAILAELNLRFAGQDILFTEVINKSSGTYSLTFTHDGATVSLTNLTNATGVDAIQFVAVSLPGDKHASTEAFAIDTQEGVHASITLPTMLHTDAIMRCTSWDFGSSTCGSWELTEIPFSQGAMSITFEGDAAYAYIGRYQEASLSFTPALTSFLVDDEVMYLVNLSNASTSLSIPNASCNITYSGNDILLDYEETSSLYTGIVNFTLAGEHTLLFACDASVLSQIITQIHTVTIEDANVSENITHDQIQVGKRVGWTKKQKLRNANIDSRSIFVNISVPIDATNVILEKIEFLGQGGNTRESIILEEGTAAQNGPSYVQKNATNDTIEFTIQDIIQPNEQSEYKVSFTTDAPYQLEIQTLEQNTIKRILVSSSVSLPYTNVETSTTIPETHAQPRLYHLIDGQRMDITLDPGYDVRFLDTNDNGMLDLIEWIVPHLSDQWFEVGLATINTNQSIYHPDEVAEMLIVVLDNTGKLVSAVNVTLNVTDPSGESQFFRTDNLSLLGIERGIYRAHYMQTSQEGNYSLNVEAYGDGVNNTMGSYFTVAAYYAFDIIRYTPVTLDPEDGASRSSFRVYSHTNATGFNVTERLPINFTVPDSGGGVVTETNDSRYITWTNVSDGENLTYTFVTPPTTPALWEMGLATVDYEEGTAKTFTEARSWMLAIDPQLQDPQCVSGACCQWFQDDVFFGATGGTGGTTTVTDTWFLGDNCPGGTTAAGRAAAGCYIKNMSVLFFYGDSQGTTAQVDSGRGSVFSTTGQRYDAVVFDGVAAGESVGPAWGCNEQAAYNTWQSPPYNQVCNLTGHGFTNVTDNPSYLMQVYAGKKSSSVLTGVKYNWCWTQVAPDLQNANVSPGSGGWGESFNFSVNAVDPQGNNVTMWAWDSVSPTGPWNYIGGEKGTSCSFASPCNLSTLYSGYSCSDVTGSGQRFYYFNATDNTSAYANTTVKGFQIAEDDAELLHIQGDTEVINRSRSSYTLMMRVNDTDTGTWAVEQPVASAYITYDATGKIERQVPPTTNSSGHVFVDFGPACIGGNQYVVGNQSWRMEILAGDGCYIANKSSNYSVIIMGTITNSFSYPSGGAQYTRGDPITFSGDSFDDCDAARTGIATSDIIFNITGPDGFNEVCTGGDVTNRVNGTYDCLWDSSNTVEGSYNVTFISYEDYHHNGTILEQDSFTIVAPPILKVANVTPRSGGFGGNFTFSINVTDKGDNVTVSAWAKKVSDSTWTQLMPDTINCTACNDWMIINWSMNNQFICADSAYAGETWQFRFNATDTAGNTDITTVAGSDFYDDNNQFTIGPDDINISLISGNDSTGDLVTPTEFVVRVFDVTAETFNLSSNATLGFNITIDGQTWKESYTSPNTSNSTGYVYHYFLPNSDCEWGAGVQRWIAYTDTSETCYNFNITPDNYTINLTIPCVPSISIVNISKPTHIFENRSWTLYTEIYSLIVASTGVAESIALPPEWNTTQNLTIGIGAIGDRTTKNATWDIYATSAMNFNYTINLSAISDEANSDTESVKVSVFQHLPSACPSLALNASHGNVSYNVCTINVTLDAEYDNSTYAAMIEKDNVFIASFECPAGRYRLGNLTVYWEGSDAVSIAKVETWNSKEWVDILHSERLLSTATRKDIPIMEHQIAPNGTGYCNVRITNVGEKDLSIDYIALEAYYEPKVSILDIITNISGVEHYGMSTNDSNLNVTVVIENSRNYSFSLNITLNITNGSNATVNSSVASSIIKDGNVTFHHGFLNINTSNWSIGNYTIRAVIEFDGSYAYRNEPFIIDFPSATVDTSPYFCNGTNNTLNVTIYHPFLDSITYNVTPIIPPGWTATPTSILVNLSGQSWGDAIFNLSSGQTVENISLNISINYSYPNGIKKVLFTNMTIENSNDIAIFEVTRETPYTPTKSRVMESRFAVRNVGCAATSDTTYVKEKLSAGWIPANPNLDSNSNGSSVQLVDSAVDLEANVVTWELGTFAVNQYGILTYEILSPNSYSSPGTFEFNISWEGSHNFTEDNPFSAQSANYTNESHFQFDLEVIQKAEYPNPETRSSQPNLTYNYSIKVTNIGNLNATDWNITLTNATTCSVDTIYSSGAYDSGSDKIVWTISHLPVRNYVYLNLSMNCTELGKTVFEVQAVKNNISHVTVTNSTAFQCNGTECSSMSSFIFTKPGDPRYERLKDINISVYYNWSGVNLTIGEGYVNISDDHNRSYSIWQGSSFTSTDGTTHVNFSLRGDELANFAQAKHLIGVHSLADATFNATGNVSVTNIKYSWEEGQLFTDPEDLFTICKIYDYTPLMRYPNLTIDGFNKSVGGWGEDFNFSAEVSDRFGRDVTVNLYHRQGIGEWIFVQQKVCTACSEYTQMNFTYDYSGGNISATDGWSFKLNATNADGGTTLLGFTYTVEKDDTNTTVIGPANGVTIRRNDTTTFSVRVHDVDNQTYPNGTMADSIIYISIVGTSLFESSPPALLPNLGYVNRTFNNTGGGNNDWCADTTSFFLGLHAWKGGTEDDDELKTNISAARNFTLVGTLNNTMTGPDGSANYTRGSNIRFTGSAIDDCKADSTSTAEIVYVISHNDYNTNCTADANGACTIVSNNTMPLGFYNVTMSSNKTLHDNGTRVYEDRFFLGTVPALENPIKIPAATVVPWGLSPINFSVNVTDIDNDTVIVNLWIKNSSVDYFNASQGSCTYCINYTFNVSRNFTYQDIGGNIWYFKFNASDSSSIGLNETFATLFNITTDAIDLRLMGGNNSKVNRSGANWTNLSVTIIDAIIGKNTFNDTTPNISLTELSFQIYNGTQFITNASAETENGSTNYYRVFEPNCFFEAGNHDWYVEVNGSEAYTYNSSPIAKVQVWADITAVYLAPTGSTDYERGSTVSLLGNLSDDCLLGITAGNTTFQLKSATEDRRRPLYKTNNTGGEGDFLDLAYATDVGINDTTTYATITSNGTGFARVNYTFQINDTLSSAILSIITATTIGENNYGGTIHIYNFTTGDFVEYDNITWTTPGINL
ncbi:MAG: hypothetical protein ABIH34_06475, partial [Nanoarchaeota archaeon]